MLILFIIGIDYYYILLLNVELGYKKWIDTKRTAKLLLSHYKQLFDSNIVKYDE